VDVAEPSSPRDPDSAERARRAAFDDAFREHYLHCCAVAESIVRDPQLAEDAVQEAFAAFWTHPQSFDPGRGSLRPWLLTIVRRRAIDAVRRAERQRALYQAVSYSEPAEELPVDDLLTRRELADLSAAVENLPEAQRTVIHLLYWGDLTQSQVASKVAAPLGTIKARTRGGLQRLRAVLGVSGT
jgi:RNA polymerase sigma-70 factor (ECF subfamily)